MANSARTSAPFQSSESSSHNPLNYDFRRLNIAAFEAHSPIVGNAAHLLERAYQTSLAIESISQILIADDCERDRDTEGQPLHVHLREGLIVAIRQMSSSLHDEICRKADQFEEMLTSNDCIGSKA
jgi:hypothetical protein